MLTAQNVIDAIRERGSNARDLRDAAHEAHHAIESGAKRWDRESIHRALKKKRPGEMFASEVMARAVEQLVCRDFGEDCGTVDEWAFISFMEATKSQLPFSGYETFAEAVKKTMTTEEARKAADAVIALGSK